MIEAWRLDYNHVRPHSALEALSYGDVFGALDKVSRALGQTMNPTVYTSAEFSKRKAVDNAFVTRVLEGPKVWVFGAGDTALVSA